VRSIFVNMRF